MGLINLSSPRRGRPCNAVQKSITQCVRILPVLDRLCKSKRITKTQQDIALQFKRVAIAIYPSIGAPNMLTSYSKHERSTSVIDSNIELFKMWKTLIAQIERRCGRVACDTLIHTLIDDIEVPGLLDDIDIEMSVIRNFRTALNIAGEILFGNNTNAID